jgi:hypothetical protein
MIAYDGITSYRKIQEPAKEVNEFLKIQADNPPSADWARIFLKTPPQGVTSWLPSEATSPEQPYSFQECSSLGLLPSTLYNTHKATGDGVSLAVNIYHPGVAPTHFEEYKMFLSNCWKVSEENYGNPSTKVYLHDRGAAFTYGDVIFFLRTFDNNVRDAILPEIVDRAVATLTSSNCVSLTAEKTDKTRNLYTNQEEYTGWIIHDTVRTKVDLSNLPTHVFAETKNPTDAILPEGPLPEGFPMEPAEPLPRPMIPNQNYSTTEDFSEIVTYQDPDLKGPGCGWLFAGLTPPNVNVKDLESRKKTSLDQAQSLVDIAAQNYVNQQLRKVRAGFTIASSIETWNDYVNELQLVHERWNWLTNERLKLEEPWNDYIALHTYWINFDNAKANALSRYEKAVEECKVANDAVDKWEEVWGALYLHRQEELERQQTTTTQPSVTTTTINSSTTTTGSTTTTTMPQVEIPPKPESCTPPEPPQILQETKPAEPVPPSIPAGVTIPNSWAKPLTNPVIILEP